MDQIHEIELEDCPICRGIGTMEDEAGWCVYVSCLDCGAQTAHVSYSKLHTFGTSARSFIPALATESAKDGMLSEHSVLFTA